MKKYSVFIISVLLIALASCDKEEKEPTDDELSRDVLYNVMVNSYLWNDLMPEVKKENYPDPYELLEAMRYKKLDRWSFVQDYDDYIQQTQAIFVGHGIRIGLDDSDQTRIAQIYKNAELYKKGVRRGWIIKKLNGVDLAPVFMLNDRGAAYSALIGAPVAGITNKFLFETPDGEEIELEDTKASFTLNTVIHYDTLELKTGTTGHLVFEQFIPPSEDELKEAFEFFSQNNINNIIVDLRYNGGGDLSVLQILAAYIGGSSTFGKPFLKYKHNDQLKSEDRTINFRTAPHPVSVEKVIIITTRMTASASENLINGLKPYLEVMTVGETTNGKPVGMYGITYPKNFTEYIFWPITLSIFNSADKGDFYDGFPPDVEVHDDITRDWNDRNEASLNAAIELLEGGSKSSKGGYTYRNPIIFSEGTKRANGAYIIE